MNVDEVAALLRAGGPASGSRLATQLRVSPNTVSRALALLGDRVIRLGRGRASRYALARPVGRSGSHWPLSRINADGRAEALGELHSFHGGWFLEPQHALPVHVRGEFSAGVFPDLPWFLDDLRPQGYLGRAFVHRYGPALDAPANLDLWQADDVVIALLRQGQDLQGDLVLGAQALELALAATVIDDPDATIAPADRASRYPQLAAQAEAGDPAGSSAGGEQPKFTAVLADPDGGREAVIVKFARHDPDNAAPRRWVNLLACEAIASDVLSAHGIAAARTEIIDSDGWRFLQSSRFDRTPAGGRVGIVSLRALDAAYVGHGSGSWLHEADALLAEGLLSPEDAQRMRCVFHFGQLIGNADMHFGNVSFYVDRHGPGVRLAPVYDMLPMHYRPGAGGNVHDRPFASPLPLPHDHAAWRWAADAAREFWRRVKIDERIEPAFRDIARGNEDRVLLLMQRIGA